MIQVFITSIGLTGDDVVPFTDEVARSKATARVPDAVHGASFAQKC